MTVKFIFIYHIKIVGNIAAKNNTNYAIFQNVLIAITIYGISSKAYTINIVAN